MTEKLKAASFKDRREWGEWVLLLWGQSFPRYNAELCSLLGRTSHFLYIKPLVVFLSFLSKLSLQKFSFCAPENYLISRLAGVPLEFQHWGGWVGYQASLGYAAPPWRLGVGDLL